MNISQLLILVAVLVCPITMGTMMWLMRKDMHAKMGHDMADQHKPSKVSTSEKEQN